jgi:hypothetical protein
VQEQLSFQPYVKMPCAPGALSLTLKELGVK